MKALVKTIAIPLIGIVASLLIAFSVPVEHRVQVGVIAGLVAIALGVWQAHSDSQPDTSNDRPV